LRRRSILAFAAAVAALGRNRPALAASEVAIGYQLVYQPHIAAIARGSVEAATGWAVKWVKFDSGQRAIDALAAGEIQFAFAGSSPIAAGASGGVDLRLCWIAADIGAAEALVARDGTAIDPADPQTLRGKRIAVAFGSTSHFQLLVALGHWSIPETAVTLLDLQPNQLIATWERSDVDAGFVWEPALGRLLRTGKLIVTSGDIAAWGEPTFDGLVVAGSFAKANAGFVIALLQALEAPVADYRADPAAWTADSEPVQAIVSVVGGDPRDVPGVLAHHGFPTLEEQASARWLGDGAESGAVRTLANGSAFLARQGRIGTVQPDYARFVTADFVVAAEKLEG
jgi:taurine transport system substrate-binding protein